MTPANFTDLRGLTIRQPWAWLIEQGYKTIENRTWRPPETLIGEWIAIHAGLAPWDASDTAHPFWGLDCPAPLVDQAALRVIDAQRGHIVAVARVAGVATVSDWMCDADRPWFTGPFGWVLDSITAIDPVPCRGAQGLWRVPPEVLAVVKERVRP